MRSFKLKSEADFDDLPIRYQILRPNLVTDFVSLNQVS
jgi:hypothetical protein